MKKTLKSNRKYILLLFILICLPFFISCGGVTPAGPTISSFIADPPSITEGDSSTLSWVVTGATTVSINQGIGTVAAPSGSTTVTPASTATYTLTATNSTGSSTDMVTVTVLSGANYVITATAGEGGQISPSGIMTVGDGDSQTFAITADAGYQIHDVLVDGVSVGALSTYTFTNVIQNHTIQAAFVVIGPKVYNVNTGVGYDTIQQAIDAAVDMQTIIVNPGIFYENIKFQGKKNITVQSSDPLDPTVVSATIIDGGGSDSVVEFLTDNTSTLRGFTIRNGYTTKMGRGGGITVWRSSPSIKNNNISDNKTTDKGGGIYIYMSSPSIGNNIITGNTAKNGGGIYMYQSTFILEKNIITSNSASRLYGVAHGGGIYVDDSSITINNNTITDNTADEGGGIYVYWWSNPTIKDNIIEYNSAESYGGGIWVCPSSNLLPGFSRPGGWGSGREDIPTGVPLFPAEGEVYKISGNIFVGNKKITVTSDTYTYGSHVYFQ